MAMFIILYVLAAVQNVLEMLLMNQDDRVAIKHLQWVVIDQVKLQ